MMGGAPVINPSLFPLSHFLLVGKYVTGIDPPPTPHIKLYGYVKLLSSGIERERERWLREEVLYVQNDLLPI